MPVQPGRPSTSGIGLGAAKAAPNPIPNVDGLPGWTGNVTVAMMLAGFVEEKLLTALVV